MPSSIKMYHLKPVVVRDFVVKTPKCMYKLANIHSPKKVDSLENHVTPPNRNLDIFDQVKQFLKVFHHLSTYCTFWTRFKLFAVFKRAVNLPYLQEIAGEPRHYYQFLWRTVK